MATLRSRTKFNLSLVTLTLRLHRPSPARMCRRKRPQGAQSHADRRVRPDAQADAWGLGEPQQASRNIPKGYSGSLLAYVIGNFRYCRIFRFPLHAVLKTMNTEQILIFIVYILGVDLFAVSS